MQNHFTGALSTTPALFINSNLVSSCKENANVPEGESCSVTVNPFINLREAQESDPQLSKIIEIKNCRFPKPQIERTKDPKLKIWYCHYDGWLGLLVANILALII